MTEAEIQGWVAYFKIKVERQLKRYWRFLQTLQIMAEDKTMAAFRQITARTQKLKSSMSGLSGAFSGLKGVIAGVVGVGALLTFSKQEMSLGDRLQ